MTKTIILGIVIAGIIGVGITTAYAGNVKLGSTDLQGNQIINLGDPTEQTNAATKEYVDFQNGLAGAAVSGDAVAMSGVGTGSIFCANQNEIMNMDATISQGIFGGFFSMTDGTLFGGGNLSTGNLGTTSYSLTGIITLDPFCNDPVPTVITVSGNCGFNQNINFATTSGVTGTFLGNVACV